MSTSSAMVHARTKFQKPMGYQAPGELQSDPLILTPYLYPLNFFDQEVEKHLHASEASMQVHSLRRGKWVARGKGNIWGAPLLWCRHAVGKKPSFFSCFISVITLDCLYLYGLQ